MIKMEVDSKEDEGRATTNSSEIKNKTINGIANNRIMPMDLSKAGLALSEAFLIGAGRSPLGIALSTAVGSAIAGSSNHPILLSPVPGANAASTSISANLTTTATTAISPPTPNQTRRKSSAILIGPNGQIQLDCLICSDRATGKHYGSISCDGCKGFFRRTIRKKHNYICRFSRSCVVDKNQRNSCRRCRFEKCLANGMRPEAVQLERDRIAATRKSNTDKNIDGEDVQSGQKQLTPMTSNGDSIESSSAGTNCANCLQHSISTITNPSASSTTISMPPPLSPTSLENRNRIAAKAEQVLERLMEAERILRQPPKKGTVEKNGTEAVAPFIMSSASPGTVARMATTGDVTDSMHQQLILLVEWAKQLEEFRRLPLRSQIALLRHFSAQHLVICAAFRSMAASADVVSDAVWLANDRCVPRDAPKIPDVNRVVARILDHLTAPMRRLHLEDREFVALKAVVFFDPMAKDMEPSAMVEVEETRQRILAAFEHQVISSEHKKGKMPLRLANLLLLLPPLMAIGRDLVEEAQLAKLFGLANVDELMAELLLPEDAETRSYSRLRTTVTSSIVQSNVTSPTPPTTSPHCQQFLLQQQQPSPIAPVITAGSLQQLIAAPTPIYSPVTPLMLHSPNLLGNFGRK